MHTQLTRKLRHGLSSLFLVLLLSSCAQGPVRTETVTVRVPVYVALPADLLLPCYVTLPDVLTNGSMAEYAVNLQACVRTDADKLIKIRGLQP
jgi:hypothetical protein